MAMTNKIRGGFKGGRGGVHLSLFAQNLTFLNVNLGLKSVNLKIPH